jgi:hypothetical protein
VGLGAEIGADRLTLVAADQSGRRLLAWHRSRPSGERGSGRVVAQTVALVREAAAVLRTRDLVPAGVGLAVVEPDRVPVVEGISQPLGRLGYLVTGVDPLPAATLAQWRRGGHSGDETLLYLSGASAVDLILLQTGTDPSRTTAREAELDILAIQAGNGNTRVLEVLTATASQLGDEVVERAARCHPDLVLLGDYYIPLAEWLLPVLVRRLRQWTQPVGTGRIRVDVSNLGYEAVALGSALIALERHER